MYSTIFLGLSLAAWITILVVLVLFLSLIFTKIPEDVAFMGVIAGLVHTGVLQWLMKHVLGTPRSYPAAIVRLMGTVAGLSVILMVFAGSVVIGKAIETTGIAQTLAEGVMQVCNGKPLLVMSMMCLTAMFVTAFISNTATGAIFFPIVYHSAVSMGCNPIPFLIALMVAVSSSFATPIGSPTHLLVYGPGGYRFTDFLKAGIPMTIVILLANLLIVNLIYPL